MITSQDTLVRKRDMMAEPILQIRDLSVYYNKKKT